MQNLKDSFGRQFSYLRLSVTDACNFRCTYCLPNGFHGNTKNFLNVDEIARLARVFARMGTRKIRLTGGEPTLRTDLDDIIGALRATEGIERIALSTNGWSLARKVPLVDQINVSIDSLDRARFADRTGRDLLPEILEGIDRAAMPTKINAVLMREHFDEDFALFLNYVRSRPVAVRFIELMPTHDNHSLFEAQHMRASRVRDLLIGEGWSARERTVTDGPAFEYEHSSYAGRIGFVAPYAPSFCENCNRLRVTARGGLRLCLFGDEDYPIRRHLQPGADEQAFEAELRALVLGKKKISHFLERGEIGNNRSFSAMGG